MHIDDLIEYLEDCLLDNIIPQNGLEHFIADIEGVDPSEVSYVINNLCPRFLRDTICIPELIDRCNILLKALDDLDLKTQIMSIRGCYKLCANLYTKEMLDLLTKKENSNG